MNDTGRWAVATLFILILSLVVFGCEEEPAVEEPDEPEVDEETEAVQQQEEMEPQQQEDEQQEDEDGDEMALADPSEESQRLLEVIEDYEDWDYYAGLDTHFESGHPGDVWVRAHGNQQGIEAVDQQQIPVPEGAIFVKREYDADGADEPFAVTVMEKLSDESGDWYWLKADPALERVVVGPEDMPLEGTENLGCIDCHGQASDDDYLMAPEAVGE